MLKIGLTGGIGSGKSTICKLFKELGVPVIDSDEIAHALVEPGTSALHMITKLFGHQVLQEDGSLNRAQVREQVFNDKIKREQLESLLHPLIRKEMQRQINALNSPYVILAIPLLLEKAWQENLDRVLVIDCSEAQQRERVIKRDESSAQTIDLIMFSQIQRDVRINAADDIIDNTGSLDALRGQINRLHQRYLKLVSLNGITQHTKKDI